jgi:hypothetical protein
VLDRGSGFYHISRLPPDPYAEFGRGLCLVAALTVDFTVSERPDGGSHARVVLRGGARAAEACGPGRCALARWPNQPLTPALSWRQGAGRPLRETSTARK